MKPLIWITVGAAALAGVSAYALYQESVTAVYFANIPAMLLAGLVSGNIHAPHPVAFAVASFGQWALALGLCRLLLVGLRKRKEPIQSTETTRGK